MREEKFNPSFGDDCNDIFQALYNKDIEFVADGKVKTLIESIKDTNDFKELKERTRGNPVIAYVAMKSMIPQLEQLSRELPKDGTPANQKQKDNIRQRMRSLVKRSTGKAEDSQKMFDVVGIGSGNGINTDEDVADALEMSKRFEDDEQFNFIMELAGRYIQMADTRIKTRTDVGMDAIVGIHQSNDLANILPEELADDNMFAINFMDEKLQTYKYMGKKEQGKGPIIVCIDESGSMKGWCYQFSRSILFAIYLMSIQQNRPFFVNRFASGVISHEIKSTKDILSIIGKFMNGGTDFNCALNASFNQIETNSEFNKADIIFITDGMDVINPAVMDKIKSEKERISLKIISLMVGYGYLDTLKGFSDKVFQCTDEESSKTFCEEVFSI
jgi:uncharacterized protein with von Willebrand factor type A (vWA) domain